MKCWGVTNTGMNMDKNTLAFIRKGLYRDPGNYELYLLMGMQYQERDPDPGKPSIMCTGV